MNIAYSVLLAIFFYFAITICYKIMGKREISELSIFDFVMNLIIADVVATGIVEEQFWLDSLAGLITLVCLQIFMARLQLKNTKIRQYLDGEPSMIIQDGLIDYIELKELRIQLDEVIMLLRQKSVLNIEDIQYAIIEPNGNFTVYEKQFPTKIFPLPFIISGEFKPFAIEKAGYSVCWLKEQLLANDIEFGPKIKFLFYSSTHLTLHTKTDVQKLKIY